MKLCIEIDLDAVSYDEFLSFGEQPFYTWLKDLVKAEELIKEKIEPYFKKYPEIIKSSGKELIELLDVLIRNNEKP